MRDMEIRGIGNIIGRQQHGHIAAIGFDLYTKLLGDSVRKVKGRKELLPDWETSLEMTPKGTLPADYIPFNKQRMAYHQRIAKIKALEDVDRLSEDLRDIYGPRPETVDRLMLGVRLRVMGHDRGFMLVNAGLHRAHLVYHDSQTQRADPSKLAALDGIDGLKVTLAAKGDNMAVTFEDHDGEGKIAEKLIRVFQNMDRTVEELQLLQAEARAEAAERRRNLPVDHPDKTPKIDNRDKKLKRKRKVRVR